MPGLKKLITSLKPRAVRDGDELPIGPFPLKRTNARLHRRNKSNNLQVRTGLDLAYNNIPVPGSSPVSRQNSFEPGQSVDDFATELLASAVRPKNTHILERQPQRGDSPVLVSRHGLKINTAPRVLSAQRPPLGNLGGDSSGYLGDVDNNGEHSWKEASKDSPKQGNVLRSISSSSKLSSSQISSVRTFETSTTQQPPTPETVLSSDSEQELQSDFPQVESSKSRGKKPVPAIRDLDWSQLDDQEAEDLINYYNPATDGVPSPQLIAHNIVAPGPGLMERPAEDNNDTHRGLDDLQARKIDPQTLMRRWLNNQDFTQELADFHANEVWEQHRRAQRLEEARCRFEELFAQQKKRAEEVAKQQEEDRRQAEELAKQQQEEEDARLAAERARLRDCVVCGDSKEPLEFPAKAPAKACEHPSQTCVECLRSWMASEFDTKGCDGLKCPECPATLDYVEVQESASAETFVAFDKLATRNALGSLEEFAWCLKAGCGSGQINVNNMDFMDCVSCGYKQCLKHKVLWHKGETCDQYEYRVSGQQARDEEKKTEEMLDSMSKKCPNKGCGWRIQKISGCEHMTCKRCKHEFCWLCLAAHADIKREGNTAHAKDCKFHSDNIKPSWPFNVH